MTLTAGTRVAERTTSDLWELAEGVLVRVAGQPADLVAGLRTPAAFAWTERLLTLEGLRDAARDRLRASLEEVVTARQAVIPNDAGALINLRRDVFNGRRPRPSTAQHARPLMPAQTVELLDAWLTLEADVHAVGLEGAMVLETDLGKARAHARVILANDDFRSGVLLQSAVLERNMDKYLDPDRKLDKHARQAERTLLKLYYRAALKTSPFSTLTSVALGRIRDDVVRLRPEPLSLRQRSAVASNTAVIARLAVHILSRPDLREGLNVTVAPGTSWEGELVRYVRRRRSASADPDSVVSIDNVYEDLFFLPGGPALADVADFAAEPVPLRALVARLMAADPSRTEEEVEHLLAHLLRLDFLLVPELQLDLHSAQPGEQFIQALSLQPQLALQNVAAHLRESRELVASYPSTPMSGRAALLGQVRGAIKAAFAAVEAPENLVPRTVLYEDTTISDEGMSLNRPAMAATLLEPLARLAEILPAFDASLPRRLTTLGFFKARYAAGGRCEDLEQFCHEFQRDFFEPFTGRTMRRQIVDADNNCVRQENWLRIPEIGELDDARASASQYLRELYANSGPVGDQIDLGEEFLTHVRARLPQSSLRQPWSFFVQLTHPEDVTRPVRCVFDKAFSGLTLMFSRFSHALDARGSEASALMTQTLRDATPQGAVFAELCGGYETTNLNIHPVVTAYELVCPGDISHRPAPEQIFLSDLEILHDVETDELILRSRTLGMRVIPVYLGFLLPMALPEIQQVLLCFSPSGMAQLDLWAGTGDLIPAAKIRRYPRLVIGNLVLQRRHWKLEQGVLPIRSGSESESDYFLRVQRWRHAVGLPRRFFAKGDMGDASAPDEDETVESPNRNVGRKPLAVDLESWFSVQMLEQVALAATGGLILAEALPDTDELWLTDENGRPRVSELLVELYPSKGASHV